MRLIDGDVFSCLGLVFCDECLVDVGIELTRDVIRDVENVAWLLSHGRTQPKRSEGCRGGQTFSHDDLRRAQASHNPAYKDHA
jgi:hypothetical protein